MEDHIKKIPGNRWGEQVLAFVLALTSLLPAWAVVSSVEGLGTVGAGVISIIYVLIVAGIAYWIHHRGGTVAWYMTKGETPLPDLDLVPTLDVGLEDDDVDMKVIRNHRLVLENFRSCLVGLVSKEEVEAALARHVLSAQNDYDATEENDANSHKAVRRGVERFRRYLESHAQALDGCKYRLVFKPWLVLIVFLAAFPLVSTVSRAYATPVATFTLVDRGWVKPTKSEIRQELPNKKGLIRVVTAEVTEEMLGDLDHMVCHVFTAAKRDEVEQRYADEAAGRRKSPSRKDGAAGRPSRR